MTTEPGPAPPRARPPRVRGRLVLIGLVAACSGVAALGWAISPEGDCGTAAQCRARDVAFWLVVAGGWVVLAATLVAVHRMRRRAPASAGVPATIGLLVAVALPIVALPTYTKLRFGVAALSPEKREARHAAARARFVELVDGTRAAVFPGNRFTVDTVAGTREANSNDTCEDESYKLSITLSSADKPADLTAAAVAYWRQAGLPASDGGPTFARVEGDDVVVVLSVSEFQGYATIYGGGPCLPMA